MGLGDECSKLLCESVGLYHTLVESRLPLIEALMSNTAIEHSETNEVYLTSG